jgi:O-antigen/teichoic acid export membrane protein
VLVTQTDKLIMSGLLSLENYGYFTLAVLVAGGIMMVSGPISGAIMPRMAKLEAEEKHDEMIHIYRRSTQVVTITAGSVAIMLACFAQPILYVWTGNRHIAEVAAPVMRLYAIGYGILAVGAFPYYLQYAKGKLKLHIAGSILFVVILLPILFWATREYGMIGAGYAWLGVNLLYFLTWTFVVHHTYAKGIHTTWLLYDVIVLIALPAIVAYALSGVMIEGSRFMMLGEIIGAGGIVVLLALFSSASVREKIFIKLKRATA